MQYIVIIILSIFTVLGGAIGYIMKDSTPPVIVYRDKECEPVIKEVQKTGEPSAELKELSIKLSECDKKLKNCWWTYNNDCGMDCPEPEECEICENLAPERAEYLKEIDNILKSRDEARASESRLLDELNNCKAKLPF